MKIKETLMKEHRFVFLIIFTILLIPIIVQAIIISDLYALRSVGEYELLLMLFSGEQLFFDSGFLNLLAEIVFFVSIPVFCAIASIKFSGTRLLHSIKLGLSLILEARFWKYIGLVYIPMLVVLYLFMILNNNFMTAEYITSLTSSATIAYLIIGLAVIILIMIETLVYTFIIGNINYLRTDAGVIASLKMTRKGDICQIARVNLISSLFTFFVVLIGYFYLMSIDTVTLMGKLPTNGISVIVMAMILQITLLWVKVSYILNGSKNAEIDNIKQ